MTIQAQRTRSRRPEPESPWGRDAARLLALLEEGPHDAVTIASMREHGIESPAQVIYALQLAGYDIDRAPPPGNSCGPPGYRLRSGIPNFDGRADASRHEQPMNDSCHRRLHHELIDAHTSPEKEKIATRPTAG